jgi:hypothetical protein
VDRRPLATLLALGLIGTVPAPASAASIDALLAGSPSGTLTDEPSAVAQTPKGTLSDKPTASGTASGGSGSSGSTQGGAGSQVATASALPFTGSDPRVTLLLGCAAILAGAGLRLRTGDARDF